MRLKDTKIARYLLHLRSMQRVNMAMSRGAATSAMRRIDPHDPRTWEFSGFSQNGEDGIIEYLSRSIKVPNRYFIEIGASDGVENNTTWLALAMRFSGLMIEGDPDQAALCKYWISHLCSGVECNSFFVNKDSVPYLRKLAVHWSPDVFSLDIDGNDYYVASSLLEHDFRPKIIVVEYNSVFGPELKLSIPYDPNFVIREGYAVSLYYGCSIAAWKQLLHKYDYEFITVDQNGVNAFFVDPKQVCMETFTSLKKQEYLSAASHDREYRMSREQRFNLIKDMPLTKL